MWATFLIVLLALVVFLVAVLLIRAGGYLRPVEPVEPAELPEVDAEAVALRLGTAIRCETVSQDIDRPADPLELVKLQLELQRAYPLAHAALLRERVSDYGWVYIWKGAEPDLLPVMLCAHLDVIPADPNSLDEWEQPPFSGALAEGYVYGRGALDDKSQAVTILEAVETLLQAGYQPRRTVYLAFGADEEIGGYRGTARIAEWLEARGERLEAVLDEGGGVVRGILPGVNSPAAMIGVSEKGYLTLHLTVQGVEGHTSTPPPSTAIGVLARAVQRLESNPLPARLDFIRRTYKEAGAAASPWLQLVLANAWLFGGLIRRRLSASPQTNAALRTTTAVTMIQGGIKDNVLPPKAEAAVNFRLMPGDSAAGVIDFVRRAIADERVSMDVPEGGSWEASPVTDTASEAYRSLCRSARRVYPDAVAVPYLVLSATDGRHYTGLSSQVFRFTPFELDRDDLERIHGMNERISVQTLARMVQFYTLLLQEWAG